MCRSIAPILACAFAAVALALDDPVAPLEENETLDNDTEVAGEEPGAHNESAEWQVGGGVLINTSAFTLQNESVLVSSSSQLRGHGGRSRCRWRQTGGCSAKGPREPYHDKGCRAKISKWDSGFCDCNGNGKQDWREPGYGCSSTPGTCLHACRGESGWRHRTCAAGTWISCAGRWEGSKCCYDGRYTCLDSSWLSCKGKWTGLKCCYAGRYTCHPSSWFSCKGHWTGSKCCFQNR